MSWQQTVCFLISDVTVRDGSCCWKLGSSVEKVDLRTVVVVVGALTGGAEMRGLQSVSVVGESVHFNHSSAGSSWNQSWRGLFTIVFSWRGSARTLIPERRKKLNQHSNMTTKWGWNQLSDCFISTKSPQRAQDYFQEVLSRYRSVTSVNEGIRPVYNGYVAL